ncbi:MAG TPA: hypothetical protein ENJ79_04155 [Gammaproteobacteria bacterium]|nr:hypothetical protein [Gammaproteobacteria bacterium]
MTPGLIRLLAALALLGLSLTGLAGAPDLRQLERVRAHGVALRWDNIEADSRRVAGQQPAKNLRSGLHEVELAPGKWIETWLDAGSLLRIRPLPLGHSREDAPTAVVQGLRFETATAAGLYLQRQPEPGPDGDFLLRAPAPGPWLARIHLSGLARHARRLILFRSRTVALPEDEAWARREDRFHEAEPAPGSEPLPEQGGRGSIVHLREDEGPGQLRFMRVAAGRIQEIHVTGPLRYRLEQRMPFERPQTGPSNYLFYHQLDDGPIQLRHATVSPVRRRMLYLDGKPVLVSSLRTDYIEVPPGPHRLRFGFSETLLLRVLAAPADDLLLPELNIDTSRWQASSAANAREGEFRPPQVDMPVATLLNTVERMVTDNRYHGGGLAGPMALLDIARARPELPALYDEALELLHRHSYYDNLVPLEAPHGVFRARVRIRQLERPGPGRHLTRFVFRDGEQNMLAAGLAAPWFTQLESGESVQFALPDRPSDSFLRILLPVSSAGASLELSMDNEPPLRLRLRPAPAWPTRLGPAQALAGLDTGTALSGTGQAAMHWQQAVAETRTVTVLELRLPRHVQRVRIRQTTDQAPAVPVALQYRAARPYRLSETSYRQLLDWIGREDLLQALWRACLHQTETALDPQARLPDALLPGRHLTAFQRAVARELIHQWIPLLRWLEARRLAFRAGLAPPAGDKAGREYTSIPTRRLNEILRAARHAERAGHWQAAVEYWGQLLRATPVQQRQAALSGTVRALTALGEDGLAGQLLRGAYVRDTPPAFEALRYRTLYRFYRSRGAGNRLDGLVAIGLQRAPVAQLAERMSALHERLLANGRRQDARLLAELLVRDGLTASPRRQARQPGRETKTRENASWHWRPASGLLRGGAGMAWLYAPALDLGFDTLRATPGRPVRLSIEGPVRLRLDVLPLHPADSGDAPLDAWLQIRSATRAWISPISGNRPSNSLSWPGRGKRPGRIERRELNLPAGHHQLEIRSLEHEVLLRLFLEDAGRGNGGPYLRDVEPVADGTVDWPSSPGTSHCRKHPGALFECELSVPDATPVREVRRTSGATSRLTRSASATAQGLKIPASPLPWPLMPLVEVGRDTVRSAYAELVMLAWQQEKAGADRQAVTAQAHALVAGIQEPLPRTWARPLLSRISRGARWQAVEYVEQSGGLRFVERPAHVPESPSLRVRAALLDERCRDARLLTGHDELVYTQYRLRPAHLTVELLNCAPPHAAPAGLDIQLRLQPDPGDGNGVQTIHLDGATTQRNLPLRVGRGEQQLRLKLAQPVRDHYIAVRIHDPGLPAQATDERSYQLATRDEPLRLHIEGPAWLRIDELEIDPATHRAESFSRYLAVEPGWQKLELGPSGGRAESLYRLFLRKADAPAANDTRVASHTLAQQAPPDYSLPLLEATPPLLPRDALTPGGQEDGTPSLGLRLVSRTRVDDEEDSTGGRFRENFAELRGEYRRFDALDKRYWRGEVLARLREEGEPTLGFGQHLYQWPFMRWPGVQTSLHLTGFVQDPGRARSGRNSDTEWSLNGSGRVLAHFPLAPRSYHEPALTLFVRELSLSRNERYRASDLDRDVFSRYRADHRRGLRLSEYLVHRPWMDTEWYARAGLSSNEDFDLLRPDSLDARIGWRQLAGDLDLDAAYRLRHDFDDRDRRTAATRNELRLRLNWMHWRKAQQRLALGLGLRHDIDRGETSLVLELFLHGGNGRGLRDFRGNEVRFDTLRERDMPRDENRVTAP